MLQRIVLSLIVAAATTLALIFVGTLAVDYSELQPLVFAGAFAKQYAATIGLIVGVWWFFTHP